MSGLRPKTKRVPITISRQDYERASKIAAQDDESFASLVRKLIKKFLRSYDEGLTK